MARRDDREHLTAENLNALVARRLPFNEETEVLLHLLVCTRCERELRGRHPVAGPAMLLQVFGRRHLPDSRSCQPNYGRLSRGMEAVRRSVRELQDAESYWKQLAIESPQHRSLKIRNTDAFHTLGMAVVLLEESYSRWLDDPANAASLAADALLVLRACRHRGEVRPQLHDVMARAYTYQGNCRRILGHLQDAERDFHHAHQCLESGTGDPLERALVLEYQASLFRGQSRLVDAKMAARESARLYAELADTRGACRVVLLEALVLREANQADRGVKALQRLLSRYSLSEMGADNHYRAHHNLVLLLADAGRVAEAKLHLPRVRRMAERQGSRFDRIREQWLEATIHDRAGEIEPAEACYRRVLDFFVAEGIGYDAAFVTLDLAAMLLTVGRTAEVRELAQEMTPIFLANDIQCEAIAALTLFQRAAAQEAATAALARETARTVRRAQRIQPGCERHPG